MSPSSVCARRHFHVGPVSAGLENLPRALDPRRILFPQSTLPSFRCPARNNSARVPSPMDGADASSPARGQRVHWTLAFRLPRAASATSPAHSASSPSTEQSVQHSHSISAARAASTPSSPFPPRAKKPHRHCRLSPESSSPVNSPATVHLRPKPHPEHHLDVIKRPEFSSLRTRRFTDLPIFLPTRHRRPRGLHRATPCHPQRTPSTDRGAPPVNVYVDEPPLRKTPRLPLLFPRSLG